MNKIHILYISDCYRGLSIYDSQVHTLCQAHAKHNDVTLIALSNYKDWYIPNYRNLNYKFHKYFTPSMKINPVINRIASRLINCKSLIEKADIIHCRGHVGTALGLNLLRKYKIEKSIIADIRGAVTDEISNSKSWLRRKLANYSERLERCVFENASFFFFVSKNMKKFYLDKYGVDSSKTAVFPTIVDNRYFYGDHNIRIQMRKQLNIPDETVVFVYSGNLRYNENIDMILKSFAIAQKKRNDIFLLLLTKETKEARAKIKKSNISKNKYLIFSCPYPDVGKYLNLADVGLLIREKRITNLVACPVKSNEYLTCGLNVITTIPYYDSNNMILTEFNINDISNTMINYMRIRKKSHSIFGLSDVYNIVRRQVEIYRNLI